MYIFKCNNIFLPCTCLMVPRSCCTDIFVIRHVRDTFVGCMIMVQIDCTLFRVCCTFTTAANTSPKAVKKPIKAVHWACLGWGGRGWEGMGRDRTLSFYYYAVGCFAFYYLGVGTLAFHASLYCVFYMCRMIDYHHASSSIVLTHCECLAGVQGRKIHEVYKLTKTALCVVRFHVHFQV